jgi:hypothetical protein
MRKKGLPAYKNFKPGESEVERSLRVNFSDRIIKKRLPKLVNEWKPKCIHYCEYYSRQEVARANGVECDY